MYFGNIYIYIYKYIYIYIYKVFCVLFFVCFWLMCCKYLLPVFDLTFYFVSLLMCRSFKFL